MAFVVLRYYQAAWQCFSEWTRDELRAFSDFNRKVSAQLAADLRQRRKERRQGRGWDTRPTTDARFPPWPSRTC